MSELRGFLEIQMLKCFFLTCRHCATEEEAFEHEDEDRAVQEMEGKGWRFDGKGPICADCIKEIKEKRNKKFNLSKEASEYPLTPDELPGGQPFTIVLSEPWTPGKLDLSKTIVNDEEE